MSRSSKEKKIAAWNRIAPQLRVADIFLTRDSPPDWRLSVSATIRKVTNSDWAHVGMIFSVPNKKLLLNNVLIIEATDNGIEIHRVQKYLKHIHRCHIGIKRVPGLTKADRERILAYMLNNVDVPYDFTRLFALLMKKFSNNFTNKYDSLIKKDDFICSSFVQKSYFKALRNKKNKIIFTDLFNSMMSLEEVTPADIAKSTKSKWIFDSRKY